MIAVYVFSGILLMLIIAVLIGSLAEKEPSDPDQAGLRPEQRQEAALEALRDIEFEYQTGKLLEDDYLALRNKYATLALGARDSMARRSEAAAPNCHACGEPFKGRARFCPRCGAEQAAPPASDEESGT